MRSCLSGDNGECCVALGAELYNDGFANITNIDTSAVVVNQMSDKYVELEEMECTPKNEKSW